VQIENFLKQSLMKTIYQIFIKVFLLFIITLSGLYADDSIIVLQTESDLLLIGKQTFFLKDKESVLTISDILKPEIQKQFQRNTKDVFSHRPTPSTFWLKITIKNLTKKDIWIELGSTFLWTINFYVERNKTYQLVTETGSLRPETNKAYPSNLFWLPLHDTSAETTIYIQIHTQRPIVVPIQVGSIFSLSQNKTKQDYIISGFVGIMIVMFFYNLFLLLSIKDKLYFWYIGYVFFSIPSITYINNYPLLNFIFTENLSGFLYSHVFVWINIPLIFTGLFAIEFLNLSQRATLKRSILFLSVYFYILLSVIEFFEIIPHYLLVRIYQPISFLILLYLFCVSLYIWLKEKKKNARFYCLGWLWIVLSMLTYYLSVNGTIEYSYITRNAILFGVGMETLLFSFALGDKINSIREENIRIIREQNQTLKQTVEEKTKELLTDIQKRKDIEEELRKSEEALAKSNTFSISVIDSLFQHLVVLDSQGFIIAVNKAWKRFSIENGNNPNYNFIGMNYLGICTKAPAYSYGEEADVAKAGILAVISGKLPEYSLEYPCHSPTEKRWFLMHVSPILGSTKGVVITHANITVRKMAEIAILQSEERLKTLGNNLPNGAIYQVVHNANGEVYFPYISSGIKRMFGVNAKDIMQNATKLHSLIHPEDAERIAKAEKKSAEDLVPFEEEFRQYTVSGELRWVFCRSMPRKLEDDSIVWDGIVSDITVQKHTQEALKESKEMAESANRAKSEFLANMSHEIRTPLNSILGFSKILKSNLEDEKLLHYTNSIINSGTILLKLINDFLDLSKIESGKIELFNVPISIKHILEEMETLFSYQIAEKKLKFIIEIANNVPEILILDETRLRQVILNLIGNSIKFTDIGYVKVTVTCERFTIPSNSITLILKIEDTGIGIPEYEQNKVFESFTQVKGQDNRKYGGTGLGLAISKRLVQLMGGEICLTSVVKKGTTFTIILTNVTIGHEDNTEKNSKTEWIDIDNEANHQDFTNSLSFSQITDSQALYTILKEEKFSHWEATQEIIDIDEILRFAKDMMNLGKLHNCTNLSEWAKEVEKFASTYNIKKMSDTLALFPKILESLSNYANR
jgi:PAS domain S-box-containing protein